MPNVMPSFYRPGPKPGMELPLFWRDEVSGILSDAVNAYFDYRLYKAPHPSQPQFKLLIDYLRHYINAPCWTYSCADAFEEELRTLRDKVADLRSCDEVAAWVVDCMDIGLDPF